MVSETGISYSSKTEIIEQRYIRENSYYFKVKNFKIEKEIVPIAKKISRLWPSCTMLKLQL